jgi:hypothetical protein
VNRTEVAKLLTILSGFDRRQVDELTVEAWHAIPEIAAARFDHAEQIALEHQTGPHAAEYFAVRHLVTGLRRRTRTTTGDVEADVRSAKARGLIEDTWPRRDPLPPDVAARLAQAREHDRQQAARYTPQIEAQP